MDDHQNLHNTHCHTPLMHCHFLLLWLLMHTPPDLLQENAGNANSLVTDHRTAPCQGELLHQYVHTVAELVTLLTSASSSMVSQLTATPEPGAGAEAQVVDQAPQDPLHPGTQSHLPVPSTPLLQGAPDMQHTPKVCLTLGVIFIAPRP
jgi:hypothetical protein